MNDILRIAISAGLFRNQTVFDNENIKSAIPDNTFGVFVGIDRSAKHALLDWPNRVHGCIGYWDPDYKVMDKNLILTKMMQVSKSATWEDNRRKYFKHSIYLDLYAKYKVYFMLGPIKEIDNDGFIKETGEMFDNDKYGLIVVNANDQYQRATYLPDVFSVTDWSHIKDSLIQKADIIDPTKISFYAYDSLIVSMTLADYFVMPFNHFINHRYQEFVPHTINNNIVIIDKTDDVRNLANIYDILMMERYNYPLDETVKQSIINNIDYYINKYKHITRQATPFMMLALYTINP